VVIVLTRIDDESLVLAVGTGLCFVCKKEGQVSQMLLLAYWLTPASSMPMKDFCTTVSKAGLQALSRNLFQARTLAKRCENDRLDHPCQSTGPKSEELFLLRIPNRTTNLKSIAREPSIPEVFERSSLGERAFVRNGS
jgi:hypothetical protein